MYDRLHTRYQRFDGQLLTVFKLQQHVLGCMFALALELADISLSNLHLKNDTANSIVLSWFLGIVS